MPSQICHLLAGTRSLRGFVPAAPEAFNIGCQGPDIFAHNRTTKPFALAYARLLHRHGYGRFCAVFSEYLLQYPSPEAISWFYGFITHQAVDRILHPYIVSRCPESGRSAFPGDLVSPRVSPALYHAFLERILDVCLFRELTGQSVSAMDTGKAFAITDEEIGILAPPIARALELVYSHESSGDDLVSRRVLNAFVDAREFYQITNPAGTTMANGYGAAAVSSFAGRGASGVALLYPDEPDSSIDWLNARGRPWPHPVNGDVLRDSVPELFERAVGEASGCVALLTDVLSGIAGPEALEGRIGNACLSVCKEDGSIAVVEHRDPFPLERALLDEVEKRRIWFGGTLSVDPAVTELV